MKRYSTEIENKIVAPNIQDGRSIVSFATEYGVSTASINNLVHDYRKECQVTLETMNELELMEQNRILKKKLSEAEKENDFLIKTAAFFAKETSN
ncbi:Transposase [Erysipelothrix urinaevulpis]